jgi:hypothetical protein
MTQIWIPGDILKYYDVQNNDRLTLIQVIRMSRNWPGCYTCVSSDSGELMEIDPAGRGLHDTQVCEVEKALWSKA